MLSQIRQRLEAENIPAVLQGDGVAQAAVLLALTNVEDDPQVLLTRRASHLSSHSGEVSLPGGKYDPEDLTLERTALRETWEEIGLEPHLVEIISPLSLRATRQGMNVAPYVGIVPDELDLTPNYDELDAIFRMPLRFLLEDRRLRTDKFIRDGYTFWSPAYDFEGFEVWGFTARLLVEFLNQVGGADIQFHNPAPVKDWGRV